MLYRNIPKTGDKLSVLGFGCMRLPQKNGKVNEKRAIAQIRQAIEQGVNYIDTAYFYHNGTSETIVGKALSGGYRERVRLATKLPPWGVKVRQDMDNILRDQLKKLQTDRIDYYLLHAIYGRDMWDRMRALGVIEFLEKAKQDGIIANIGFSFHGNTQVFKAIIDDYDWDFCQIQYNYLDELNQAGTEGLEYAAAKRLGIVIMEPLRGGSLAGGIPPVVQRVWDRAEVKRSPAEWALRWVWNRPEVTVVLSGMNEEGHIAENIRIANDAWPNSLTDDELELVDKVKATYRKMMKVGCTGCGYCMPCPAGVNIPMCFERYNAKYLFNINWLIARLDYLIRLGGVLNANKSNASLCMECGKCERKCPQHIPIRQELKAVANEFEGYLTNPLIWLGKMIMKARR